MGAKDIINTTLDDKLPTIYSSQIRQENKLPGNSTPCRSYFCMIAMLSYVLALTGLIITTTNINDSRSLSTFPGNEKKRQFVALGCKSFPALTKKEVNNKSIHKKQQKYPKPLHPQ
eukprot:5526771-Ditylum_brightwellii.AAC.1